MSSLVYDSSKFKLTPVLLPGILQKLKLALKDRVEKVYVFGSASGTDFHEGSDIDLILVVKEPKNPFPTRAFEFLDLFEIYPDLDILVYSRDELERQLADSAIGFWKSVRESMRVL